MKKVFRISGMTCPHCVKAVEIELKNLGLESFSVEIGKAEIVYDQDKVNNEDIINAISEAGYRVEE